LSKRRGFSVLYLVALVILPFIFHWRILTPNALDRGSFPSGDFADQFYAFARFAYEELAQGRLPLWNPFTFAGHPFIADIQSAVFYPPSLIVMAASSLLGGFSLYVLEWQAVLHFSLAGVLTFLFARRELLEAWPAARSGQHVPRLAAFIAALVFTFGGYLTSYPSQQLAILETDVWLPLVLLCVSYSIGHSPGRVGARSGTLLAGLFLGMALLAGHPQSLLYVLIVTLAYTAFQGRRRGLPWAQIAVRLLAILAIALGVSAVQWIPSLEFMQLSSRSSLTYDDYARGFELQDPLQLLLPGSVSLYSPLYVGILPLALAVCALWLPRRPGRPAVFWLVLALCALALSFGGNLFLYPLLYLFAPGFALFRQQERAAFIFSFALAILSGYGALAIGQALSSGAQRRLRGMLRLSAGALCGAFFLFTLLYLAWTAAQLSHDSPFREASSHAVWLLLMLMLLSGVLWARLHGRLKRARLLAGIAGIVVLDLFTVNQHTNFGPLAPEAQTRPPAILEPVLADHGVFRTFNEYRVAGNFGDMFRIADTWGASPLRLARYEQFHKLPLERVWSLMNVKYVITWRKSLSEMGVESEVVAEAKVSETETTYVHRLLRVSPRAALASRVDLAASNDDALRMLAAPEFDVARQAVLESQQSLGLSSGDSGQPTLVSQIPNGSTWAITGTSQSLFVISENFYPGWRAFVDGREAQILRANSVMMAVVVPGGDHRVEFVFDPFSVKLGAGISALSLIALTGIAIVSLWGKRRRRSDDNRPATQ
jgi:Bacterial membrane protein YfhO